MGAKATTFLAATGFVLLASVILRAWDPLPVAQLRFFVFDSYQRLKPRPYEPALPVKIVDIDSESLDRYGPWPWPRTLIARLVHNLDEMGAAAIAIDHVFTHADPLSPDRIIDMLPAESPVWQWLASPEAIRSNDAVLAATIAEAPVVLGFQARDTSRGQPPFLRARILSAGGDAKPFVPAYPVAVASLPELQRAAQGSAALNWLPAADDVVRELPLLVRVGNALYPSLVLETLRVALSTATVSVALGDPTSRDLLDRRSGIKQVQVGAFSVPTASDGSLRLWYGPSDPGRYVPAWRVLDKELSRADAEAVIFLIGSSSPRLSASVRTTLGQWLPATELYAQAIEQILRGRFLDRPALSSAAEMAYLLAAGILVALVTLWLGSIAGGILTTLAAIGALTASWLAFDRSGWLVDPLFPALAVASVFATGAALKFHRLQKVRNSLRAAFSDRMAPARIERLVRNPRRLKLDGERRTLSVMFAGAHGFSERDEQADAEALTRFATRLFRPLASIVIDQWGTIDRRGGDSLTAYWNAPLPDDEHAGNACRAALRMIRQAEVLNAQWVAEAHPHGHAQNQIAIGIGLVTGDCCVANLGSPEHIDFALIGELASSAAQLARQTEAYGLAIVADQATVARTPRLAWLEIDQFRYAGGDSIMSSYALLGDETVARLSTYTDLVPLHAEMLKHFRAGHWTAAEHVLRQCQKAQGFGLDDLYAVYLDRITRYRHNPPPSGWVGVIDLPAKVRRLRIA